MIYQFEEGSERKAKYDKLYHELFGQYQNKDKRINWQEDKTICSCGTLMTVYAKGHDIWFKCHHCDIKTMTPNQGQKIVSNKDEKLKEEYNEKHKQLKELFENLLTEEEKEQNKKEQEEWNKMFIPVKIGRRTLKNDWSNVDFSQLKPIDDALYFVDPIKNK